LYRYVFIALFAAAAATTSTATVTAAPALDATVGDPASAIYGSETLDLADDWGTANACIELGAVTECYDTEADLLAAHTEVRSVARSIGVTRDAAALSSVTCSSSLRMYDGTSYTGGILYLNTRGVSHNLSNFGFDNVTSSYKVGACSASFFSSPNLGGSVYPGYTGAWAQSSTMAGGWNNVVSSVYIY
jgi:hypothetical protein